MEIALPPLRSGYPPPPDLAGRRAQLAAAVAAGTWKTRQPAEETLVAGRRALRFQPEGDAKAVVLHLHGGGFRLGAPECEGPFAEALANACQVEVIVPDYRLAPEDPFPAGLTDVLGCVRALRKATTEAPLVVSGASAGAGLAASLGVLATREDVSRIDALILLSPWLDLTVSAPSYFTNAGCDPLFSKAAADIAAELYLQGFDKTHPLVSPRYAALSHYPPTLICVGTTEVLLDDSLRFHSKLQAAGFGSSLLTIEAMEHIAVVRGTSLNGAAEVFSAITRFVCEIAKAI